MTDRIPPLPHPNVHFQCSASNRLVLSSTQLLRRPHSQNFSLRIELHSPPRSRTPFGLGPLVSPSAGSASEQLVGDGGVWCTVIKRTEPDSPVSSTVVSFIVLDMTFMVFAHIARIYNIRLYYCPCRSCYTQPLCLVAFTYNTSQRDLHNHGCTYMKGERSGEGTDRRRFGHH